MNPEDLQAWWDTPLGREHFIAVLNDVLSEDELEDVMEWASDPYEFRMPRELIERIRKRVGL